MAKDPALFKGVNICLGKCVYKTVADDLGLNYEALGKSSQKTHY